MGGDKGITLIALVITIIVMLILVTVTITIAVDGELFDYAGRAAKETQNHVNNETSLSSGTVENKTINEIVDEHTQQSSDPTKKAEL